ncbi:transcriptional regulator TACO1-like protein [Lipomyces oligophaga]|uniref:transcriptional regulator TACO1-like protein n=1 Tax=Lipomyces oligophaga TaxID=45792 RepID=UPI0034CD7A78
MNGQLCRGVGSGHNKWSTIKHTKFANDAQRAKEIIKYTRGIISAAKVGGPDPESNVHLYNALETARRNHVPKKTIESAMRRAMGISDSKGKVLENVTYEALGPGGSAIVIECLTDNKNRTLSSVRQVFNKHGGSLAPSLFYFQRKGVIRLVKLLEPVSFDFDTLFEQALECGAEDIEVLDQDYLEPDDPDYGSPVYQILVEPAETARFANRMRSEYGYEIKEMGIEYVPNKDTLVQLGEEQGQSIGAVIHDLEELDDVQDVYTNAN